ncbi:hypothetical protein RF11_06020 [Thelohanellus kitauei]|uniref:Uncharacterized protein n=1 Tax=Thelohanellus kitauei TaxID=669202 RepID=A0A0C2J1F3_THEKT|nr:hypothetical protein RF11_06020 [Thelohanellus kitauei]
MFSKCNVEIPSQKTHISRCIRVHSFNWLPSYERDNSQRPSLSRWVRRRSQEQPVPDKNPWLAVNTSLESLLKCPLKHPAPMGIASSCLRNTGLGWFATYAVA